MTRKQFAQVAIATAFMGVAWATHGADKQDIATCNSFAQVVKSIFVQRNVGVDKQQVIAGYQAMAEKRYSEMEGPDPDTIMIFIRTAVDSAYSFPSSTAPSEVARQQYIRCIDSLN